MMISDVSDWYFPGERGRFHILGSVYSFRRLWRTAKLKLYFAEEISKFATSHFQTDEREDFLCNYFLEIITSLVTFYSPSECQRYVSRLSCSPFLEISLSTSISLFHSFSLVLEKYFTRHISSRSFSTQEVKYPYKEHLCITFTALSLVWVLSMAEIRRFHNIPVDIAWFSCGFCRNLVILIRNRI